jgi:hypothetical protein
MKQINPTKNNLTILHQVCKLIPSHLTAKVSREFGVDKKCRTFSPWSHVVSLLFAQLTHSIGLNDVCDALRLHKAKLGAIRGAVPPSRNNLSHANRVRNSDMMESLFWRVLKHLDGMNSQFGPSGKYSGFPQRFMKEVHAIDSSTIALVANCMSWAKHRRRKAACKLHLNLNLNTFLPSFAIIEEAAHHDSTRMIELCAHLQDGEIAVFDKAYVHFSHLYELDKKGVYWVIRAKDNMSYRVCKRRLKKPSGNILKDEEITLKTPNTKKQFPQRFRRIEAKIEINGKVVTMAFISNNMEWAASSICDLYRSRWGIEAFFKQLKQTLKICDFLGNSKHAIRWQLWSALLLYVLLRFQVFMSQWTQSFIRMFTLIRSVVWDRFDLNELTKSYGTAGGLYRLLYKHQQLYLKGFEGNAMG